MNRSGVRVLVWLLVTVLVAGSGGASLRALAQTGQDVNPNAVITWPPPVYVLRGEVEILGSANLPNQRNYFISFRQIDETFVPISNEFLPAMLPRPFSVENDVLGTWDTTTADDGLYELRLTVNVRGAAPVVHIVSPLRIENNPPPFTGVIPPTPTRTPFPTVPPPPTLDPTPRGIVRGAAANVRTGDSTEFPVITTLRQNDEVLLIGVSNRGTGWYQVRLSNGRIGWMAPSVIDVSGNLGLLPFVSPPPLPPTPTPIPPTPTPIPSATPFSAANLIPGIIVFDPPTPTCAQTFIVGVDVANIGSEQTFAPGIVSVSDARAADGTVQQTAIGGYPPLLPGQTTRVNIPLTITTWYNEVHRITLTVDASNTIPESSETDNVRVIEYVLQKGGCP